MAVIAAFGREGRIERQIRRAFIGNNGRPLSTTELARYGGEPYQFRLTTEHF